MLYRMRAEFGFSDYEIANFTGIPTKTINKMMAQTRAILDSDILKILRGIDSRQELHEWRELPDGHGEKQGYYIVKDYPAWYQEALEDRRIPLNDYRDKPDITIGDKLEAEWDEKLKTTSNSPENPEP
jgi:hypothetical protein